MSIRYIKVTSKHSVHKAFSELCKKAEELDIQIEFLGHNTIITHKGKTYFLADEETASKYDFESLDSFPPIFDFALLLEKDK